MEWWNEYGIHHILQLCILIISGSCSKKQLSHFKQCGTTLVLQCQIHKPQSKLSLVFLSLLLYFCLGCLLLGLNHCSHPHFFTQKKTGSWKRANKGSQVSRVSWWSWLSLGYTSWDSTSLGSHVWKSVELCVMYGKQPAIFKVVWLKVRSSKFIYHMVWQVSILTEFCSSILGEWWTPKPQCPKWVMSFLFITWCALAKHMPFDSARMAKAMAANKSILVAKSCQDEKTVFDGSICSQSYRPFEKTSDICI